MFGWSVLAQISVSDQKWKYSIGTTQTGTFFFSIAFFTLFFFLNLTPNVKQWKPCLQTPTWLSHISNWYLWALYKKTVWPCEVALVLYLNEKEQMRKNKNIKKVPSTRKCKFCQSSPPAWCCSVQACSTCISWIKKEKVSGRSSAKCSASRSERASLSRRSPS